MPAEAMARATRSFRCDAWLVCLEPSYTEAVKVKCIDSGNDVRHKGPNQVVDRLRFVLLRHRVSDHMMTWAWQRANPRYVETRLP